MTEPSTDIQTVSPAAKEQAKPAYDRRKGDFGRLVTTILLVVFAGSVSFVLFQFYQKITVLEENDQSLAVLMDSQEKMDRRLSALHERLDQINGVTPETITALQNDLTELKERARTENDTLAHALFEQAMNNHLPFDGALKLAQNYAPDAVKEKLVLIAPYAAQGLKSRAELVTGYYETQREETTARFLPAWLSRWIAIRPSQKQQQQNVNANLDELIEASTSKPALDDWRREGKARIAADEALWLWQNAQKDEAP